jgi:hypothetical protein
MAKVRLGELTIAKGSLKLGGLEQSPEEAALRQLREKLRLGQVLLALFAMLFTSVPDLRGLHGFRIGEVELLEPAERQQTQESASPVARTFEDLEEFFGDGGPDARIRAVILALSDGAQLRRCAQSWSPTWRSGCAHPPTGPPAV